MEIENRKGFRKEEKKGKKKAAQRSLTLFQQNQQLSQATAEVAACVS